MNDDSYFPGINESEASNARFSDGPGSFRDNLTIIDANSVQYYDSYENVGVSRHYI